MPNSFKQIAVLLILSSFSLAFAETRSRDTASLSGVVKGGSGTNMAVHLEPTTQSPVRYYDGYEATLKNDGSFTLTEIPPGEYRISIEENTITPPDPAAPIRSQVTPHLAYDRDRRQWSAISTNLSTNLGTSIITLHPGEARKGVVIELAHRLSFCGHVTHDIAPTDAWGRKTGPSNIVPVDTSISFLHYNSEFGILENEVKVDTNKDGSFQVTDLAPGTYYVHSFETWFPGVRSFDQAQPVIVPEASAESCKVDFQLIASNSCSTGEIFGEIKSDTSADKNQYEISFLSRNQKSVSAAGTYISSMPFNKMTAQVAGDNFLTQICSGDYDVVLSQKQHAGNNLWASTPTPKIVFDTQHVSVPPNGAAHVVLTPHAMASIEGEVILERVAKEDFCPNCQSIYVSILREGDGEFQTTLLSSGNHFDFRNVTPGEYQIFITSTRLDKVFLQSIQADGIEGHGSHFTVSEPKFVSMKVTLSGDLAQAAGHASPDVRGQKRWQTEGMRPLASVSGRIEGDRNTVYVVRLLAIGHNSNAEDNLVTQSTADGSFSLGAVPPGLYRLRAHNKSLVRFDYGAKAAEQLGEPLLIAPGAQIKNLTINSSTNSFTSSICGHLTDTDGNSRSTRIWFRSTAVPNQFQQAKEATTDNGGYFRIDGLNAGDYLLQAPDLGRVITLSADGQLYAGVPVHLADGRNVGCGASSPLELHFPANGGSMHTISGLIRGDLPVRLGDRFIVELKDAADSGPYPYQISGKLDADHKFFLEHVHSGNYTLSIYGVYGPEPQTNESGHHVVISSVRMYSEPLRHLIATQTIAVRDQDLSGLELTPLMLPVVAGVIHIQHPPANWKDFQLSDLNVNLVPHRKTGALSAPVTLNASGQAEFAIAAADTGEYEVQIQSVKPNGLDRGLYVQSAKLDGKEVNARFLTLPSEATAHLEIEIGSDMASVHVKVNPDISVPLPAIPLNERCQGPARYAVILFPNPLVSPAFNSEPEQAPNLFTGWSHGTSCDDVVSGAMQNMNGKIQLIPPGSYYALAVKDRSLQFWGNGLREPISVKRNQLLDALTSIATPVVLHAGDNLQFELSDKTVDASRIAARIGVADEYENLQQQNSSSCCGH